MAKFFISDTHFNHEKAITHFEFRPFKNVDDMNKKLIFNWNQRVKQEDEVYFLGDFCFKGNYKTWREKLNGNIIFVRGNHDCFSEETLLLTEEGYKHYSQLKIGDMIPTYNLDEKKIEYYPIDNIIIDEVDTIYGFKSRTSEGEFSNNHKLVTINHYNSYSELYKTKKIRCDELWNRKAYFIVPTSFNSNLPELDILDIELQLIAWIYTDSFITNNKIFFYQSKKEGIERIKYILNSLNISYRVKEEKIKENIVIKGKKVKNVLQPYTFIVDSADSIKILEKYNIKNKDNYPLWLNKISDRQAKIFVNEFLITDGDGNQTIWGKLKRLQNLLGLCVTHNIDANIVKDNRGDNYICIHKKNGNRRHIEPKMRYIKNIKKKIWGVTVKNHTVFTSLNGKPLLSSNSNNGLNTILTHVMLKFGNKVALAQHIPPMMKAEIPDFCDFVLCGHVHSLWKHTWIDDIPIINCSVEQWNYSPIRLDEILAYYDKIMKEKENEK